MRRFKHFSRRSKLSILFSVAGILVLAAGFMVAGLGSHTSSARADTYQSAHLNRCRHPELLSTCTPDSDSNIVDPAMSQRHPGTAFMEMQVLILPRGAPFALPGGTSCDPTKWCAALTIDSLAEDPVHSTLLKSHLRR